MTGEWIKLQLLPHDCRPFEHIENIDECGTGDEWRCDCGCVWVLEVHKSLPYPCRSFRPKKEI